MAVLLPVLGAMGAYAAYDAIMWAVENVGPGAENVEELINERMKKEAKAERGADLYESQGMELMLEAMNQAEQMGEGLHEGDIDFMRTAFGGRSGGGSERDQVVAMMDNLQPGLAERVAAASQVHVSPLAQAAGYRPGDHYAV